MPSDIKRVNQELELPDDASEDQAVAAILQLQERIALLRSQLPRRVKPRQTDPLAGFLGRS